MRKNVIIVFLLFAVQIVSYAQQKEFVVYAPERVMEGDRFMISYAIKCETDTIRNDYSFDQKNLKFQGFDQVGEAKVSKSKNESVSSIMGSLKSGKIELKYVLDAKNAGQFVLPTITAMVDGKMYTSPQRKVEVLSRDDKNFSSDVVQDKPQIIQKSDIHINGDASTDYPEVGEEFDIDYTLFIPQTDIYLISVNDVLKIDGFEILSKDVTSHYMLNSKRIDDKEYYEVSICKLRLKALKTGEYTIPPLTVKVMINQKTGRVTHTKPDGILEETELKEFEIKTGRVALEVEPATED